MREKRQHLTFYLDHQHFFQSYVYFSPARCERDGGRPLVCVPFKLSSDRLAPSKIAFKKSYRNSACSQVKIGKRFHIEPREAMQELAAIWCYVLRL